ncbi:hypothetical protein CEE39_05470 [bacterium (candidate division B38) B3_B38]|nr:MAG: hypothetical protein CEE39_05470 [bacterium (candidate division B38) B3_B38]
MKRVIIKISLSTALISLILGVFPVHAKWGTRAYNELSGPEQPQSFLVNENVRMLWFQRKAYLSQARLTEAAAEMEKLLEQKDELSRSERREFAAALIMEGDLYFARGQIPRARVSYQTALELAPILPAAYYALARSYWQKGSRYPLMALKEFVRGSFLTFKDLKNLYIIIINSASLLWLTAVIAALLFVVSKLLKYQKSLRHDLSEYLSSRLSLTMANPLSWGILLLPIFLWLGVAWIMAYWLVLLWLYCQKSEKVLGVLSLIILILALPSGNLMVSLYSSVHSPYILSSLYSIEGEYNHINIENLRQVLSENPDDLDARFLLAHQYGKGKRLELAFEEYQKIINRQPSFAKAYTNVANIFFALGEYNLAIENYKKSIALRKEQVIPHYNMALAYAENLQFKYAQEAMEKARGIDLEFVDHHQEDPATARAIIEEELPQRTLWRRLFKGIFRPPTTSAATFSAGPSPTTFLGSSLVSPTTLLGLLSLAVIILLQLFWKEKRLARLCGNCGRPFCYRCKTSIENPAYCSQCQHIFVKQKGVSQEVKIKKSIEVQRHQFWEKLKNYLLTLVFPGMGHQYGQQPIAGFLILLVWLYGLILTFLLPRLIPITIQLPEPHWGLGRIVGLTICLLSYPLALGTLKKG